MVSSGEVVVAGLDSEFADKISSIEYDWPNTTRRRNGQVVTSPRDIIDTGELDSSQRLTRARRGDWRWFWMAPHSLIVHQGATLRGGGFYPARPWTRRAVAAYKPYLKFAQEVRKRVSGN
jgi:hypothetical protein